MSAYTDNLSNTTSRQFQYQNTATLPFFAILIQLKEESLFKNLSRNVLTNFKTIEL